MRNRLIAALLMTALMMMALLPVGATAEPVTVNLTMGVKETYQINTSSLSVPEGKQLVYATSNKKIATVSAEGLITAKKKGTATIAVGYDSTVLAVCTLTILGAPKKIALSDKVLILSVSDTKQLTVTLPKKTASIITYESSDAAVATVDASGKVTAVSGGTATITVKTFNNRSAECAVTVLTGKAPTKLTLNVGTVSIQTKETFKLAPSVGEGEEAVYAYAVQNKKIATVSADGTITGKKKGVTKVAVKTHNGLSETVTVIVKGKLKDLYGCLTKQPKAFLKYARKLKMKKDTTADANTVMYYNDQAALIMTKDYCQVSLSPTTNPKYSIQGIDATMTAEQSAAKLLANGWALADTKTVDGIDVRSFTKGGDTTHVIAVSADGSDIRSIDAFLTW